MFCLSAAVKKIMKIARMFCLSVSKSKYDKMEMYVLLFCLSPKQLHAEQMFCVSVLKSQSSTLMFWLSCSLKNASTLLPYAGHLV
jgi:hypothetical protein